jgi:hypothetical protein
MAGRASLAGCNDAVPEAGAPFRAWSLATEERSGRDCARQTIQVDDFGVCDGPGAMGAPASGTVPLQNSSARALERQLLQYIHIEPGHAL